MTGESFQKDVRVLLCIPATQPRPVIPGAKVVTADCGHQVWIAPSGVMMRDATDIVSVCFGCRPASPDALVITRRQLNEVARVVPDMEAVYRDLGVMVEEEDE